MPASNNTRPTTSEGRPSHKLPGGNQKTKKEEKQGEQNEYIWDDWANYETEIQEKDQEDRWDKEDEDIVEAAETACARHVIRRKKKYGYVGDRQVPKQFFPQPRWGGKN
ncbi:hypothetical protein L873DRAFT_1790090 [Choiromyces venosus 120613-1]|uniref:Uncharacterized protein n=1 Tax=Choiromyces venosus 120613-1 TaxID=1336337 RepID=A0A3N4JKC0_9PEZI|nr:hypothetical protein L873DRAFT_1790090 [Choiromyces venosus 120613-1]